jgi:uncharacterized phage protein gp47/JayE
MAFARPTLSALIVQIRTDLASRFPGADTVYRRAALNVLSAVLGGVVYALYGYLNWISLQVMPDTAEQAQLERWAAIWGVPRQGAAAASGPIALAGSEGVLIPIGSLLQRTDGAEFATLADETIVGGVASAQVQALTPGAAGDTSAGVTLTFVSPIAGVSASATVQAPGLQGGLDEEIDDSLRARLLTRIRKPPQGGDADDYVAWTKAWSAEVTRVWVRPAWSGLGTVGVMFVMDGRADIIPTGADIAAAQAYLDAVAPVTATVLVFAPAAAAMNPALSISPDTTANRAAVVAELADLLVRLAEPGGTLKLDQIRTAIGEGMGGGDYVLTSPAADVVYGSTQVGVVGAPVWS